MKRSEQDRIMEELSKSRRQFATSDGWSFSPCSSTCRRLIPGFYKFLRTNQGPIYVRQKPNPEPLFQMPGTPVEEIASEIKRFWTLEKHYKQHGLNFKRGLLFHGRAGTGKSCAVRLVGQDVIDRGGIVVVDYDPNFATCYQPFREIEPDTPLLVVMEDLDSILENWDESSVLNVMDGMFMLHKVVFLATTNHIERLSERVKNRPSRFDRVFEIGAPIEAARRIYLKAIWPDGPEEEITEWARKSDGFSFAHLKELFVAVHMLEHKLDDVVERLRNMGKKKKSKKRSDDEKDPDSPVVVTATFAKAERTEAECEEGPCECEGAGC